MLSWRHGRSLCIIQDFITAEYNSLSYLHQMFQFTELMAEAVQIPAVDANFHVCHMHQRKQLQENSNC